MRWVEYAAGRVGDLDGWRADFASDFSDFQIDGSRVPPGVYDFL